MIDWYAEQSDQFIGTAAAILSVIAAGASAAGGITAAHMASSGAKDAAALQTDAAKYGADTQDAAAQRAETFSRQQAENEWLNSQQTLHANYDQAKSRYAAVSGVGSQYGLNLGPMPDYVPGIDPHFDTGATAVPPAGTLANAVGVNTPSSGGGDAASLKALLDSGVDPQAAVAKFNQQYGRTTGNQAVYYDPSQHGGVATIGLPDAYLAKPGASWDITQRAAAGGAQAPRAATLGSMVSPAMAQMQPTTAIPTPYQPGTLASMYLRRT